MAIVVLTRSLFPIDLTASILLAYELRRRGQGEDVEWIVEEGVDDTVYSKLMDLALFFKSQINIYVKKQCNVKELHPTTEQIIEVLLHILKKTKSEKGRIRIQHGSIIAEDDNGIKKKYRYFGFDSNNELILYDNKKNPTVINIEHSSKIKLNIEGSMNLFFLNKYGKLAHLPWYCIDTEIESIQVEEIIYPPEGCSELLFGSNVKRLQPSGYCIYDYISNNNYDYVDTFYKWLIYSGSCIRSRSNHGTNCSKTILFGLSTVLRDEIKKNGFENDLIEICKYNEKPDRNIINLLKIRCLSKMIISYETGHWQEIKEFGLFNESGNLYKDKEIILKDLVNGLEGCCNKMLFGNNHEKNIQKLSESSRPFAKIAKYSFEVANEYFNEVFYNCFGLNKATISNMINFGKTDEQVFIMFEDMLKEREDQVIKIVRGSIFEYERD